MSYWEAGYADGEAAWADDPGGEEPDPFTDWEPDCYADALAYENGFRSGWKDAGLRNAMGNLAAQMTKARMRRRL